MTQENQYSARISMPWGMAIIENGKVRTVTDGKNNPSQDEFAALATISEVLARLSNGKFVSYQLKLQSFENPNDMVKCEWSKKTGNLLNRGRATKAYHYVDTISGALAEHRTFTCPRSLLSKLPKNKFAESDSNVETAT